MTSLSQAQVNLVYRLNVAGYTVAADAITPLKSIDFEKLVNIFDHEELFLEQTFLEILIGGGSVDPPMIPSDQKTVTKANVKKALIRLGIVAAQQPDTTLSKQTRHAIIDSCGFC